MAEATKLLGAELVGVAARQGRRPTMQDDHVITRLPVEGHILLAVFDGHGSHVPANFSAEHLLDTLVNDRRWTNYVSNGCTDFNLLGVALQASFVSLEQQLLANYKQGRRSGCTALVAVVTPTHVIVANAGDSRAVLGKKESTSVPLTKEHRVQRADERARVEAAGGFIAHGRVDGHLMPTRAIGDAACNDMKARPADQKVTAVPDITIHPRAAEDTVLVLACDGVWDVLSNEHVLSLVQGILGYPHKSVQDAADVLAESALRHGSADNITVLVADLDALPSKPANPTTPTNAAMPTASA